MTSVPELFAQPRAALLEAAAARGMELPPHLEHGELVGALVAHLADAGEAVVADGELSMMHEGFGFVRLAAADYAETASDAYVSQKQIRALNLQHGHRVRGRVRAPRGAERSLSLQHVDAVQGVAVEKIGDVAPFSSRRAVVATRPLLLGDGDAFAPLARQAPWRLGHRVLVHAGPEFARAAWLRDLALAVAAANPELAVTLCLLDQRPEDLAAARAAGADAELTVVGTRFADEPKRHCEVAELALQAALRRVERGDDLVLVVDSLSALARAHARSQPPSGAWIQPGLDARAVLGPKRLFASARQLDGGGSLTVLATVQEGPTDLDQAIAREFAPGSNSDVWPEDPARSRTRPEDQG